MRPLGPIGALGDDISANNTIDMEGLLEADPDVPLRAGRYESANGYVADTGGTGEPRRRTELSAVQNDRVYAQGARYQGPILNLFQLEMTAKQLYPAKFGGVADLRRGSVPRNSGGRTAIRPAGGRGHHRGDH